MKVTVYILWSKGLSKYYVGSTKDLENRLKEHNSGEGKFTKQGMPWELVWSTILENWSDAINLENQIKKRGIKRFLEKIFGK